MIETMEQPIGRKQILFPIRLRLNQPPDSMTDGSRIVKCTERIDIGLKLQVCHASPDVFHKTGTKQQDRILVRKLKKRLRVCQLCIEFHNVKNDDSKIHDFGRLLEKCFINLMIVM